jgi:eukaryotic-like serine/threonine-protein kinase
VIGSLFSRYRVIEPLGAGGMGEVYLAEDTTLHRPVALKILPPQHVQDEERVRRFKQEAHAASALNHPNILTVHEAGESEGRHFIATEFVDGETLRTLLRRTGSLPPREVLAIGAQVASALAAAHDVGIVHRDIKPDNVMVRRDGYVKVLDFGIAKLMLQAGAVGPNAPAETHQQTAAGAVFGTLAYMSPEQARGFPVDARSDVWSLGCLLYEMLAGRPPFAGPSSTDVLVAILDRETAPLPPRVPPELDSIITKTLRKAPDERYQSSRELLNDLEQLRRKLDVDAHLRAPADGATAASEASSASFAVGSGALPTRQSLSSRPLLIAAAVVVVSAAIGVAWYLQQRSTGRTGEIRTLAVLPLKSLGADEQYLGLGIADAVIRKTNQTGGLVVRPTSAIRRYLNEDTDALSAARALGADAVLEGNVQQAGERLRVGVNLLRTNDGVSLWADSFDMRMTDIFAIQDTVAQQVASRLRLKLDPSLQAQLAKRYTANPLAYEFYLKGLYTFDQRMSLDAAQMRTMIEFFSKAIEADPDFAAAHAQLAAACALIGVFRETTDTAWADRARAEIARARALDPALAEIELARFRLLMSHYEGFNYTGAARALLSAQALDPDVGHAELGYAYMHLGLTDLAARSLTRALEIDPTSEFANEQFLSMYNFSGQYGEWLAAYQRFRPNQPVDPMYYVNTRQLDEAERAIDASVARDSFREFVLLPAKALLAALRGDSRTAEVAIPAILSRHPVKDPYYHHAAYAIACIYAIGGKSADAVKWLREAVATGFSAYPLFERDPSLDRIRSVPEFQKFMSELKITTDGYRREFDRPVR